MPRLSVQQLFEDRRERLGLAWAAGASGSHRELTNEMLSRPGLGLIGHLNLIHPLVVQVLGARELDYRLIKELWACAGQRIAVRFAYEWHDDSGNWFRSYGNENWEFDEAGYMAKRYASINDKPIAAITARKPPPCANSAPASVRSSAIDTRWPTAVGSAWCAGACRARASPSNPARRTARRPRSSATRSPRAWR